MNDDWETQHQYLHAQRGREIRDRVQEDFAHGINRALTFHFMFRPSSNMPYMISAACRSSCQRASVCVTGAPGKFTATARTQNHIQHRPRNRASSNA